MRKFIAFIAALFGSTAVFGQLVCTGNACSCENEKTPPPNFSVSQSVHVTGKLIGENGYPFVFENTVVQVRTIKKIVIVTATVDSHGQFDLGIIQTGQYRLIAARRLQNGKLERQPLADQPKPMSCSGGSSDCSITAVQHLHGTDLPFEFCPPQ